MIERFEHEKPATLEELTEEERKDLERLWRVKRGESLKIVCRDYVMYNGEWYRTHKWDWPVGEVPKARLMTLEEAVSAEVVYYEERYVHHAVTKGQNVFPVIRCVDGFSHTVEWYSPYFPEGKAHILFAPDEYGIFGRCWTSRPTDEQREATSWNE